MAGPILICGAGLSGLLLAQGLRKHNIPFRLFERDHSLRARAQGYRVRVSDAGVQALRDNLEPECFERFKKVCCAQDVAQTNVPSAILDAQTANTSGPLFKPGQPTPLSAFESVLSVDRSSAREILSHGLGDRLVFDKEFASYEQFESSVVVHFADGSNVVGAALVAADGVWSKIRRQKLPQYQLADSEARLLFGKAPLSPGLEQHLHNGILSGLKLLRSPTQTCLLEVMRFDQSERDAPSDYVYWVLFLRPEPKRSDKELLSLGSDETLQLARRLTEDWHPGFRCLFDPEFAQAAPYQIVTTRPSALPASEPSDTAGVVLIGDSAHAMPPTAALGATTALRDASVLLQCILERRQAGTYDEAFRQFETQMLEYAKTALEKSAIGGKAVLGMKSFDELPVVARP